MMAPLGSCRDSWIANQSLEYSDSIIQCLGHVLVKCVEPMGTLGLVIGGRGPHVDRNYQYENLIAYSISSLFRPFHLSEMLKMGLGTFISYVHALLRQGGTRASLNPQYPSCLRLSQRTFDSCPMTLKDIRTVRSEDTAQVDRVSLESCEECGSGDFVFPRLARMCRLCDTCN
ncbi:unnamed protein product [Prunus armeniaca]